MKKIILIPALLGVAVASGVVSTKFLTAGSAHPAKRGVQSSPEHPGKAASMAGWTAAETKPSPNGAAKRALTVAPAPSQSAPSQAKRLLNSLKDRPASAPTQLPSVTAAGAGQAPTSPASATSGGGAASSSYSGGSFSPATGGASGTSGGAGGASNGGSGVALEAAASGPDTVTPGSETGAEIVLNVPTGAIVPAGFVDNTPRTPQQQKVLDQILTEFETNVSTPDPGVTETENWNTARQIADQRYLTLFGYQAYNQHHLQAAKEALNEKKAVVSQAPTLP